jgi:quercetin dioxygenase-like cupin family protein
MQITRNTVETAQGPPDWFTGTVFIDTAASPTPPSRVGAAIVRFTPGARTAWHASAGLDDLRHRRRWPVPA